MNLLAMSWPQALMATLIVVVCFLLMVVVLLQRGRGGGLAGAFGGSGGTAAFGAKTGDVFTWITVSFGAVFFLLVIVANFAMDETPRAPKPPAVTSGEAPSPDHPEGEAPSGAPNPNLNAKKIKVNADGTISDEGGLPIELVPSPAPSGQEPADGKAGEPAPTGAAPPTPPTEKPAEKPSENPTGNPAEKPAEQPKDPSHL